MMEEAIVVIATMCLAAWIIVPLRSQKTAAPIHDDQLSDLIDAKQSVYRSLIDLELDHELGKLAPDDYARLRLQGKQEALDLIRQIDDAPDDSDEMTLEAEIKAARARLRRE
ncbi:MAG: hypothetical protein WD627_13285 [Actinomycetota bacterium]